MLNVAILQSLLIMMALNKQVHVGLVGALHVGGNTANSHFVEQFFALHAHDIHRHLAGDELHTIV